MSSFALTCLLLLNIVDAESLRFQYSTEQGYDTSCGLGTVVCLMNTYWGQKTEELALTEKYLPQKITAGDFTISFADMSQILKSEGFVTAAYKFNYKQLLAAVEKYAPILIHYSKPVGHFALVLGTHDGAVITADPAQGTVIYQQELFESRWSGYAMLVMKPDGNLLSDTLEKAVESVVGRERILERSSLSAMSVSRW